MKYIIKVQRLWKRGSVYKPSHPTVEECTVGAVSVYEIIETLQQARILYQCYSIENGGMSSDIPNSDFRIMPGEYKLQFTRTTVPLPREYTGKGLILYREADPEFIKRRIFLHAGNYPQDTEGCILLNSTYDTTENPGYGRGSMRATKRLYEIVSEHGAEKFTLIINDEHTIPFTSIM